MPELPIVGTMETRHQFAIKTRQFRGCFGLYQMRKSQIGKGFQVVDLRIDTVEVRSLSLLAPTIFSSAVSARYKKSCSPLRKTVSNRVRVTFPQNHPLRPEDFPTTRVRLRRKRWTLARLPHAFISHQRRIPLRLLSTNNHEQLSPEHCRTRANPSDVRRSAAERATSCEMRSKGWVAAGHMSR